MARLVFLDSEPLGLASQARGKPDADACRNWLQVLESAGEPAPYAYTSYAI